MSSIKKVAVIGCISFLVTLIGWVVGFGGFQSFTSVPKAQIMKETLDTNNLENAYFAGGCFWCIESIFDGTSGVYSAISGYIGGSAQTANYGQITTGTTKHREGVQVQYDTSVISYGELVEIFWRQIDPTDAGGQFADRGFQYTTAIYYSSPEEKAIAQESKQNLENSGKFDIPIVTKILPISPFYAAEEEHQNYAQKQTLRYKAYEAGSGRAGYKKNIWENDETFGKLETDEELKARLTPLQYKVTQKDGTEPAYTDGNYHDNKEPGIYVDIIDGTPLYSSLHKYDSGTGWPSFWKAIDANLLIFKEDNSLFSKRIEIRSKKADSHLGHLFPDGPDNKGGIRHCINGSSLRFIPVQNLAQEGYEEFLDDFTNG